MLRVRVIGIEGEPVRRRLDLRRLLGRQRTGLCGAALLLQ